MEILGYLDLDLFMCSCLPFYDMFLFLPCPIGSNILDVLDLDLFLDVLGSLIYFQLVSPEMV